MNNPNGTRLECTKCGDVIEVTATSIVLPFVCMSCEQKTQEFEAEVEEAEVKDFYDKMTPDTTPVAEPADELSEEFATVENTTLLIEDLEQQLVAVKNDRDELDRDNQAHAAANLSQENVLLNERLERAQNSRNFYKQELEDVLDILSEEKSKSLWQCFKDRYFDDLRKFHWSPRA